MSGNKLIIAIDGYSSCGKSTVAKALAQKLKINYIDSGAMYRAVTLYFIRNNIPVLTEHSSQKFDYAEALSKVRITFKINPKTHFSEVYLNGKNVEKEIRSMEVSEMVSHVSAIKEVRKKLVALQQVMANYGGLVMDGRDIGTTVFPHADLKIFMVANVEVRAKRRYDELIKNGLNVSVYDIRKNIESRDYEDSHRKESPLAKAADAIVLDNTWLDHEEQVNFVMKEVEKIKK